MNRELIAALAAALFLHGCGSVGEPLPPLLKIPAKVTDFRVAQLAEEADLRWTWPRLTSEGSALKDLERFEVFALDIPADAGLPPLDAFEQLGKAITVVERDALPEAGPGGEVSVRVSLADRLDKRTAFAVRGVTSRGKTSPWSDYVVTTVLRPSAAPAAPAVQPARKGVQLSWELIDGAARYVVERRTGDDEEFQVVGSTDLGRYLDDTAPLETALAYRLRSQVGEGEGAVESMASPEAAITRQDTFAPDAPGNLRAVAADNAVELTWAAVRDEDLAGYEVERNGEPAHQGLLTAPAFQDASLRRDGPNEYRVRAVDRKGNRSEPSDPATASLP